MRSTVHLRSVVLLLLLASLGCGDDPLVPLDDLPPAFHTEAVPGSGWTLVERPDFSFRLPPGFVDAGLQPIDSDAVRYLRSGDGSTLHFDYGPYTGRIRPPEDARGVREVWTRIGGRRVQLVAWTGELYGVVRAWWPGVGRWAGMEAHLLLGGTFTAASGRDDLLAAIRSVRFR